MVKRLMRSDPYTTSTEYDDLAMAIITLASHDKLKIDTKRRHAVSFGTTIMNSLAGCVPHTNNLTATSHFKALTGCLHD